MTLNLSIPEQINDIKPKITVIGIGGAGGNAVNTMINANVNNIEFIAANTDGQALSRSLTPRQIQLGKNITSGLGAGSDFEIGRQAAEESLEEVIAELGDSNMLFITTGMGGGTGSGAAPVIAKAAKEKGLVFMNEIGLDPGIDHMSAMQIIDRVRDHGAKMLLFESFTGGLVAPESDNNLWNYKFTWNPRNVVLAGQGGAAMFIQEGTYKYIPYHKLFRRTEFLTVNGSGKFEAYANRDSLKYRGIYGLEDIPTMYRGTIRKVGFSRAWNVFVQLGMTDDTYKIEDSENMSYRDFTNLFLAYSPSDSVELKFRSYLKIDQDDVMWDKFLELDIFNPNKKVGLKNASPAQILQKILSDKWTLQDDDKDMIVMQHKFGYQYKEEKRQIESSMVIKGDDQTYTAMAKTVGLPVAMAALKILNGEIKTPGVQLPITKEVYEPILKELEEYGITFIEKKVPYLGYNPENVIG